MLRKHTQKERWAMLNLRQRLAAVESAGVLQTGQSAPQGMGTQGTHGTWAFFALGLACAGLIGAAALPVLALLSPQTARANTAWADAGTFAQTAARQEAALAVAVAAGAEGSIEGSIERKLWWKMPGPAAD